MVVIERNSKNTFQGAFYHSFLLIILKGDIVELFGDHRAKKECKFWFPLRSTCHSSGSEMFHFELSDESNHVSLVELQPRISQFSDLLDQMQRFDGFEVDGYGHKKVWSTILWLPSAALENFPPDSLIPKLWPNRSTVVLCWWLPSTAQKTRSFFHTLHYLDLLWKLVTNDFSD